MVAFGAASGAAVAQTPQTPGELRFALPRPGEEPLSSVKEFVGQDESGRVALSVVVANSGAALGFLCDGTGTWQWFTGKVRRGRVALTSSAGARLTAVISGNTIRNVRVRGVRRASTAGANGTFALKPAEAGTGLTRLTKRLNGVDAEFAWVATSENIIKGAGTRGGTLIASTDVSANDVTETGEANAAPGEAVPFAFLGGIRCAVVVVKFARQQGAFLTNIGTFDQAAFDAAKKRFNDLNCGQEGFAI